MAKYRLISRGWFPVLLIIVIILGAAQSQSAWAHEDNAHEISKTNFVLIVAEDLGPRLGVYGDHTVPTPHIDRLAAEGMTFENAFTTAGVCAPSRAALITGMHQESIGAQHMRTSSFGRTRSSPYGTHSTDGQPYEAVPPAFVKAFPELLRRGGYYTANNEKTDYQFGNPPSIWNRSDKTVTLQDAAAHQPFFMMLSNADTHESRLFRPERATITLGAYAQAQANDQRYPPGFVFTDPSQVTVPAYLPDTLEVREDIARQYDGVRLLDQFVGETYAELEATGLLESTVFIFTTDHGDGLPRAKRTLFDSGTRVPLIVRFPNGQHAGERRTDLVSFVDLAPTILALAGVAPPEYFHGQDFLASDHQARMAVFAARDRMDEHPGRGRAVRTANFLYLRNFDLDQAELAPLAYRENLGSMQAIRRLAASGTLAPHIENYLQPMRAREEFYEVVTDPDQVVNLVNDNSYEAELDRHRALLSDHMAAIGDTGQVPEITMVSKMMWPDWNQPISSAPVYSCSNENGNVTIQFSDDISNASILYHIYQIDAQKDFDEAILYVGPFTFDENATLEVVSIRYGYRPSATLRLQWSQDGCVVAEEF